MISVSQSLRPFASGNVRKEGIQEYKTAISDMVERHAPERRSNEFDRPEFLARLRRGDEAAYGRLIHRFHGHLVRTAFVLIGSCAQAEEIAQDTWLAVFTQIGRFKGQCSLATWLFTIVHNRAWTRANGERRLVRWSAPTRAHWRRAISSIQRPLPEDDYGSAACVEYALDPERILAGRQLLKRAREAIAILPPLQRATIVLWDIELIDRARICRILSVSSGHQRVLLHRARQRIRCFLTSEAGLVRGPSSTDRPSHKREASLSGEPRRYRQDRGIPP
jgi:RNA polymerase sigma-70 factor (ECF subfamily)